MNALAARLLPTEERAANTPDAQQVTLAAMVTAGRLVELSTPVHGPGACTSTAVFLLRQAQREGETAAWVQPAQGHLFPPDLADSDVDLEALVVVQTPLNHASANPNAELASDLGKAAEFLLRSGAFGFVVIDLRGTKSSPRTSWQGRLLALARKHESRILLLTQKTTQAESVGPLVSLRIEPNRERSLGGSFAIENNVIKNKAGNEHPIETHFVGPMGMG